MILNLLDPTSGFAIKITQTALKYRKHLPTISGQNVKSIIIIPEGTPEDIVFPLLAHQTNGCKTSSIVKPRKGTGLGFIEFLPNYLEPPIEVVTIVVDRDWHSDETLFEEADQKLAEKGFTKTREICPHCYEYTGTFGSRPITVYLLISGCDDIDVEQHTIEDHLLKAGNITCGTSSKDTWKGLPKDEQKRVLELLANGGTGILRTNFPQHYYTLEKIKTLI